jgi:type I restriction enzyme S subunit
VYSTGFFSVSPSSQVEARYLNYCMAGRSFLTELEAISTGVTMRGFTAEQLGRRRIRVLSLEEQTAIAEYLDRETARIDALITKKQRMIELLKERRIAVVDSTILSATGYIRPIAALATYMNGWPFKPSDFTPSGTPVIRITQLTRSSDEQDYFDGLLPERVTLRDGDLVFSWSGSLEVRRWDRGHAYLNQHLFRVLPKDGVDVNWLTHALDCASRLFAEHMHGSAMTHITQPMMKMIRIPVPEVCAQARIAAELDSALQVLQTLHNAVDRQIELLRERRQALITAAVTGELDVAGVAA